MVATLEQLQLHFPFKRNFAQISGQNMHYLDEGKGAVLLALHGNPTWSFFFRNLVKELRDEYRLVVPDHIGCGFSDKPEAQNYSYRLEQRVLDIEQLVAKLQLKDITLLLHDWGGMIGLAFAARNPTLIRRLVVMNSAGFSLPPSKSFPIALTLCRLPIVGAGLIRGLNAFAWSASWIGAKYRRLPKDIRRLYRLPYSNWQQRLAVHHFVKDIPLSPKHPTWPMVNFVSQNLENICQKPLMIIWGERDFIFDRHFLAEWRRRIPHAEYHSYPEAGHYILEDLGAEAAPLIRNFLLKNPLNPAL